MQKLDKKKRAATVDDIKESMAVFVDDEGLGITMTTHVIVAIK